MSNRYNDEIEIDLKKVYFALKKGIKWVILTPAMFGLVAVIYVLFIAKPVYTSEAKILLVGNENDQSSMIGLANQFGISIPSSFRNNNNYLSIETLPEIIKSRSLVTTILLSDFLVNSEAGQKPLIKIIFNESQIAKHDSSELIARGQKYLIDEMLEIRQIKNTALFYLLINSHDPVLSQKIGLKVITELQKLQLDFSFDELIEQKEFIEGRLNVVQNELNESETKLKIFRENNLQINLSPMLLLEQERLEREIEIHTQIYLSMKEQYEEIKINEYKNISSIKVIDEPMVPIKQSRPNNVLTIIFAGILGIIIALTKIYYNHKTQ